MKKEILQPKGCGYYLAKWRFGRASFRVSELWFDGRNWWSKRDYVDGIYYKEDYDYCLGKYMTEMVVAWTNKPSAKEIK